MELVGGAATLLQHFVCYSTRVPDSPTSFLQLEDSCSIGFSRPVKCSGRLGCTVLGGEGATVVYVVGGGSQVSLWHNKSNLGKNAPILLVY